MNELIEKLKDKNYVRAFGLMEETLPGSMNCFKKVGKKNCLCFHGGQWGDPNNSNDCFNYQYTYAIKPDYQPEPEFVDLEIFALDGWLMVQRDSNCEFLPYLQTHLHCLPSLPNFEGFYMPDPVITDGHEYLFIGTVARNIAKGKKVFARFRK